MEYFIIYVVIAIFIAIINYTKKLRKSWDEIPADDTNEEMLEEEEFETFGKRIPPKRLFPTDFMTPPPPPKKKSKKVKKEKKDKTPHIDEIKRGDLTVQQPAVADFDLRKAVIYSEILTPKWRDYNNK